MEQPRSASGIGIATSSIASTRNSWWRAGCALRARLQIAPTSKYARLQITPGIWAASSIPSSSRSPSSPIRCSGHSSRLLTRTASGGWPGRCCGACSIPVVVEVMPSIRFGGGCAVALIAGPCVIESEEHVHRMAGAIAQIVGPFVFKASFDKANRTSVTAYRGPGVAEGLRILADVKAAGHAILTDIHEPAQAAAAAEVADIV